MPAKCQNEVNMAIIEWTVVLSMANAKTTEKFQLKLFQNILFDFEASCLHNSLENGYAYQLPPHHRPEIEILLNVTQSTCNPAADEDGEGIAGLAAPNYCHQILEIFADINEREKIQFKKSAQLNEWKSGKFRTSLDNNSQSPPFMCLFWIKFTPIQECSTGERILLKQLRHLFRSQSLCDVQFCFGDGGKSVGGHVSILSARSRVFAAMFQCNGMRESKTGRVDIKDIQSDIFERLLHYIYSGQIGAPLSEEAAQSLFVAADMYDITDLKEKCVQLLVPFIRIDNSISLLTWANFYSAEGLERAVLDFVAGHGKEICQLEDWEKLTVTNPQLCLVATRYLNK